MATTIQPIGLATVDVGDFNWGAPLNTGVVTFTGRLIQNGGQNPSAAVAGFWLGQPFWDSATSSMWHCDLLGAAGVATYQALSIPQFGAGVPATGDGGVFGVGVWVGRCGPAYFGVAQCGGLARGRAVR